MLMTKNLSAAETAFQAWAKGELTGDYTDFKSLISENFVRFSHPFSVSRGSYTGSLARQMMVQLIASREAQPNHLTFSNITSAIGDNTVIFQFDSQGTVGGGYPYQGWNIIAITIENEQVVGFREYFGDIDPSWFTGS
jgi:ketosteroid isomerase-like protein